MMENFPVAYDFFSQNIALVWIYKAFAVFAWMFLGLFGVHEFFSFHFPLREYFLVPPLRPYVFQRPPTMKVRLAFNCPASSQDFMLWIKLAHFRPNAQEGSCLAFLAGGFWREYSARLVLFRSFCRREKDKYVIIITLSSIVAHFSG